MLSRKFETPFKIEGCLNEEAITKSTYTSTKKGLLMVTGLQSLLREGDSNVVTKSALKTQRLPVQDSTIDEYCYLKSCYLCNKMLSLDKDVYMYRGDQGFCSIECRNRQIVFDEMREVEACTEERSKSYKQYCSTTAGRRGTSRVLEDIRRRHNPVLPHQNHWAIAS